MEQVTWSKVPDTFPWCCLALQSGLRHSEHPASPALGIVCQRGSRVGNNEGAAGNRLSVGAKHGAAAVDLRWRGPSTLNAASALQSSGSKDVQ